MDELHEGETEETGDLFSDGQDQSGGLLVHLLQDREQAVAA
ncbi:hypothetical protein ACWCV9_08510 [Streptomyces sp. NPDC001606]